MLSNNEIHLHWNAFKTNMISSLEALWEEEGHVDVTISCGGVHLQSHQMILSACSPFFKEIFKETSCSHPVLIFPETNVLNLKKLLTFIYKGEVYIEEEHLIDFLHLAEELKIKGLSGSKVLPTEKIQPEEERFTQMDDSFEDDEINLTKEVEKRLGKRRKLTAESLSQSSVDSGGEEPIKHLKVPVKLEPNYEDNGIEESLRQVCENSVQQLEENFFYSGLSSALPLYANLPFANELPPMDTLTAWAKTRSLDQLACDLMKILFTVEERIACNVNGKMGKLQFNVQKINLIKEVLCHLSGIHSSEFEEQWKVCVTKIDTSNRGLKRKFILKGMLL